MRTRVLIVDDHSNHCDALKRLLQLRGIPAYSVLSGIEAIAFVESETPTVIILDEMMPGLSGRDTLARLRVMPNASDIPVFFLSAAPAPPPEEMAQMRISRWFTKAKTSIPDILGNIEVSHGNELARKRPKPG